MDKSKDKYTVNEAKQFVLSKNASDGFIVTTMRQTIDVSLNSLDLQYSHGFEKFDLGMDTYRLNQSRNVSHIEIESSIEASSLLGLHRQTGPNRTTASPKSYGINSVSYTYRLKRDLSSVDGGFNLALEAAKSLGLAGLKPAQGTVPIPPKYGLNTPPGTYRTNAEDQITPEAAKVLGLDGQSTASLAASEPAPLENKPKRRSTLPALLVPDEIGTRECKPFRNRIFDKHACIRRTLVKAYMRIAEEANYVEANLNLLKLNDRLIRGDMKLSMDGYDLRDFCEAKAQLCQRIHTKRSDEAAAERIKTVLEIYQIEFPDCEILPAIQRCKDTTWWRRQVKKIQKQVYEQISRDYHLVSKRGETYASTPNVLLRRDQKARNRKLMSELIATNQDGQEFTLQDLIDTSVSNPEIRRAELMVRLRGFESVADNRGLSGEFYTFTCPSRFHSTNQYGQANPKYNNSSAREANEYLQQVWSRIRAKLHRDGIQVFGFRVAEPHHDGCPHWHMILFMEKERTKICRKICQRYALAESPNENGAQKHRFNFKAIDPSKGSATGYVAKYISKNINGKGLDSDEFGNCPIETAERIDTWASVNSIRQFQQIGGPSVTTWRELRRLHTEKSGLLENARLAADSSDWAAFVELMGGPFCGRDQPIQLAKRHHVDIDTGEVDSVLNKYGEPTIGKIYGVVCCGIVEVTRLYRWVIDWVKPPLENSLALVVPAPPWSTVNNCTQVNCPSRSK